MKTNDYIQIGGSLKCVVALDGTVRDIITGHTQQYKLTSCHIVITEDVLTSCGFQKNAGNVYDATLQDDNKTCVISCKFLPLKKEYLMTLTSNISIATFKKDIIILSELQDWVRVNSGFELNINEIKLAKAIKK